MSNKMLHTDYLMKVLCVLFAANIFQVVYTKEEHCRDTERKAIMLEIENGELRTEVARLKKEVWNLSEANVQFLQKNVNCTDIWHNLRQIERDKLNPQPNENRDQLVNTLSEDRPRTTESEVINENFKSLKLFMQEIEKSQNNMKEKLNILLGNVLPTSCAEAAKGKIGVFAISIPQSTLDPFPVACDYGDWMVILRRMDGSVDFNRSWTDYKIGFGNPRGEFFLGLEKLYQLTSNNCYELKFVLKDFYNNEKYAKYEAFQIGAEQEKYALKILGTYSGTAGDDFSYYKLDKFSTFDVDNDAAVNMNCAIERNGGWWWHWCGVSKLTGLYIKDGYDPMRQGINWWGWKDFYSFKLAKMMIRKKVC